MMSCREASRLISERRERELSAGERLGLRIHLLVCWFCRRYADHIDFIHEASHLVGLPAGEEPVSEVRIHDGTTLSPGAKERMKQMLRGS